MFNEYVWKTYLQSGGNAVVEMFRRNLEEELTQEFVEKIREFHSVYLTDAKILNTEADQLKIVIKSLQENLSSETEQNEEGISQIDDNEENDNPKSILEDFFCYVLTSEGEYTDKDAFGYFVDNIVSFTTDLSIGYPDSFIPYYFQFNFNVLKNIAEEFGIELPAIPAKKDYKGRFFYYGEICKALKEFQHKHNLDNYELCAFLYDFAPKYVGGAKSYIIDEDKLPEARSAFFIGGTKDDIFLSDDPNAITIWQCNPETRAGDMIVMYLLTPVSAIRSVWRSRSIGFNDPFFWYYRCTYIGNPVQINEISLDTLRKDTVLSAMPIVRKNMQGVNGVELKPSEFNRILDLAGATLPRLEYEVPDNGSQFTKEKDVEKLLIKPLLQRLDYAETDYVQQLYIEIGNHNHALIPDFVLLPRKSQGRQTAFAVLEAKLSITNRKQLDETIIQARSYAKLLGAKHQMIASQEKVWVYSAKDDFVENIFVATWNELHDADTFSQLYKMVGRK